MKWIGPSDSRAVANALMMRGITVPTCSSASSGAVLFVASFTDGRSHPSTFNLNDRSKIGLYFLLFSGIIANGENFKFDGGFYFMFPTSLWLQTPVLIFNVSQIGFVKLHHIPMLMNGGPLVHLDSSCVQLRPGI